MGSAVAKNVYMVAIVMLAIVLPMAMLSTEFSNYVLKKLLYSPSGIYNILLLAINVWHISVSR